jgi:serine protease Do
MKKFILLRWQISILLFCLAGTSVFGQVTALRNYVGIIHQTYRPEFVAYMNKFKTQFENRSNRDAASSVEEFLTTPFGSGFVYVDSAGNNYVITNQHVIAQADSLSITFQDAYENQTTYDGLTIFAADENLDIAILAFPPGSRPFTAGLVFMNSALREGDDVFAAGYPLQNGMQTWQFARGMVSTVLFRLADLDGTEMRRGPYVRHSVLIDPGNSGGPLLVVQPDGTAGYAVAGVNTFGLRRNQSARYSIPAKQIQDYIAVSLSPQNAAKDRDTMTQRVTAFVNELEGASPVYPRIAKYLASACTNANVEFAMLELFHIAPAQTQADVVNMFSGNPIDGMNFAVSWLIERTLRKRGGALTVTTRIVLPNDTGGYTVSLTLKNREIIESTWVNEYGIWRISTFGNLVTGDKQEFVEATEQQQAVAAKIKEKLQADDYRMIFLGYANLFGHGANPGADNTSGAAIMGGSRIKIKKFSFGAHIYVAGTEFLQLDAFVGGIYPIQMGSLILSPFFDVGGGFRVSDMPYGVAVTGNSQASPRYTGFDGGVNAQAGLMFTITQLPGVYLNASYQFNYFVTHEKAVREYAILPENRHMVMVGLGYAFASLPRLAKTKETD